MCIRDSPCDAVVRAMNVRLPEVIAVTGCREVPEEFHPRYSCTGKRYLYKIYNSPVRDPFLSGLALHWKYPLDENAMDAAARQFIGTHDFAAFCSAGGSVEDTVRTITACTVQQDGELYTLSVTADGYLYNMVRILAGTVLQAGLGKMNPAAVPALLQSRNRGQAGPTLPARGLFLWDVQYPDLERPND